MSSVQPRFSRMTTKTRAVPTHLKRSSTSSELRHLLHLTRHLLGHRHKRVSLLLEHAGLAMKRACRHLCTMAASLHWWVGKVVYKLMHTHTHTHTHTCVCTQTLNTHNLSYNSQVYPSLTTIDFDGVTRRSDTSSSQLVCSGSFGISDSEACADGSERWRRFLARRLVRYGVVGSA